jgi:hypothetical protein
MGMPDAGFSWLLACRVDPPRVVAVMAATRPCGEIFSDCAGSLVSKPAFSPLRTCHSAPQRLGFRRSPIITTVKAHEIYAAIDSEMLASILDWFRENDRNVYKTAIFTLAGHRKLRPVFIQKKPLSAQYEWIHKSLKIPALDAIGEQLLQAYLMSAQQSLLGMFCDGLGIPHDGKGSVLGDLPKNLDAERLDETIDRLVGLFDPKLLTLYLRCFNLQQPGGWPELGAKLEGDARLVLA